MVQSDETVQYLWRGDFANREVNALHSAAFDVPESGDDWTSRMQWSLGWVCARRGGELVGFVNVVWDGGMHAFILDTAVAPQMGRRGIGAQLIATARQEASRAGCTWLHVDFEDHLVGFYLEACGFKPTRAGIIHLRA